MENTVFLLRVNIVDYEAKNLNQDLHKFGHVTGGRNRFYLLFLYP